MSFVHLHCHSEYSLLDGANRIDDLIGRALEFEQPALAITDHGNLHGAWEFQEKAKKAGLKPMLLTESENDEKAGITKGYMGLVFKYGVEKDVIPQLQPAKIASASTWPAVWSKMVQGCSGSASAFAFNVNAIPKTR